MHREDENDVRVVNPLQLEMLDDEVNVLLKTLKKFARERARSPSPAVDDGEPGSSGVGETQVALRPRRDGKNQVPFGMQCLTSGTQ